MLLPQKIHEQDAPISIEHVQKDQEDTHETSLMENFPKHQEAQFQNINRGSFRKIFGNKISNSYSQKIIRRSGIKFQYFNNRKFSEDQESKFPNITHGKSAKIPGYHMFNKFPW